MMQPGWYYAEGDPPGSQRYWDGELWQGGPVFPPNNPQTGGYLQYGYFPESSQATTALVLGILGLVVCGILGPFAWHIGHQEITAIDAGRREPGNRGTAQAGRVLGIISSLILALGAVFLLVVVAASV